ncbi:hypothetical protein Ancab_021802 [Ancistrocladus abbreviatus]
MKGLLKGLRYISQIFEEEEKKEIQIGYPTDVKHVAHIGWDGPAVNSPGWMNEFKSSAERPGSAPPQPDGDAKGNEEANCASEDSSRKTTRDPSGRDLPEKPRASRRQPSIDSTGSVDSPSGSPKKSKELKQSRRRQSGSSSKDSKELSGSKSSRQKGVSSPRGAESSQNHPNIPKKSRRKKSKDGEGSVRCRSKGQNTRDSKRGSEEESTKSYASETYQGASLETVQEEKVKG